MSLTRRHFLAAAIGSAAGLGARRRAGAGALRSVTVSHAVSTFVYGQHLVAREKKLFEAEGLDASRFIVPGAGARVANALTAGEAMFALGGANHPLKITASGRDARILFATDTRCSYANIVVRKDLYDRGVTSVEALADPGLVGRRAVIAATAIGSG